MRQTYCMIALVLMVVLAAHFVKQTRFNVALADSLGVQRDPEPPADADVDAEADKSNDAVAHADAD